MDYRPKCEKANSEEINRKSLYVSSRKILLSQDKKEKSKK